MSVHCVDCAIRREVCQQSNLCCASTFRHKSLHDTSRPSEAAPRNNKSYIDRTSLHSRRLGGTARRLSGRRAVGPAHSRQTAREGSSYAGEAAALPKRAGPELPAPPELSSSSWQHWP